MKKTKEHTIADFAHELKVFNQNDVLVNLRQTQKIEIVDGDKSILLKENPEINKIFKTAQQHFRESGAHILCISSGILVWEWKGKTCESPILLCSAQLKFDKIKREYSLTFDESDTFLNPFLLVEFQNLFNFIWPEINFFQTNGFMLESHLKALGFELSIKNEFHVGNFHHHRYAILRDLEFLEKCDSFSQPLNELLFLETELKTSDLALTNQLLFPSDNDQLTVFKACKSKNLVVQGPPGTGKSQVINNFLGKTLSGQYATLVVSEKRVALEVLQNRLSPLGLDKFCFLPDENKNSNSLLSQVKETWLFLESCAVKPPFQLNLSKQKIDALQFKLDLLSKKNAVGGIDFSSFQAAARGYDLKNVRYNSLSASIVEFQQHKPEIQLIYSANLHEFLKFLPYRLFNIDFVAPLDKNIAKLKEKHASLSRFFDIETKAKLLVLMKKASFAQLILNEHQKAYFKILKPNSAERKKFNLLSKKYYSLKKQLEIESEEKKNWKIKPTKAETRMLLEATVNATFLQKIRLSRRMKILLESSYIPIKLALKNWLKYLETEEQFRTIEKKLMEIGVCTEQEIVWVKNISQQIIDEDWDQYTQANSNENKQLANFNATINTFYTELKMYLKMADEDSFQQLFSLAASHFSTIVFKKDHLAELSEALFNQIGKNESFEDLEKEILKSSWINFIGQYPAFENFDWSNLSDELNEIIKLQNQESQDFSVEILLKIKSNFDSLFVLLNTPNRKLKDDQINRKAKLKKGRSILIKEFAKTRRHPTIRELLSCEAAEWIKTILPVWMANPAQVADFFPLEKEQFDYVLFDEATQIPFVNALGAIYRAKRTIVVGDEQQMTPTNFFKTGESEPIDLLHQARFTWDKVMLKHHYRSQNPALIAFSNKHFYHNKLIAYPSANSSENPLQLHFVKNGQFIERENLIEAKQVAFSLETLLSKKTTLGIVAFSETQLACIFNQLSPKSRQILENRIDKNTCFFRAIENIQGDECEHLVISLGYAPNESGKLLLNFGPLNRKSGRRRLNVLFSRAKKKIDFFSSIHSSELILSENDSINLLRQFLQSVENKVENVDNIFPHELKVLVSPANKKEFQVATIQHLVEHISDANELITLHEVLSERNWLVKYS